MIYKPRTYQKFTTSRILSDEQLGAFLDMGLGKTVSSLTAVDLLMYDQLIVDKVLVIAPKRVAESVWPAEVDKWDHLRYLRVSVVVGTEKQRKEALATPADIYVINRENTAWIVALYQSAWPFKMVIIDELSSFKSPDSNRFKALKMVRPYITRMIGLTGTPASNGLMDLWAQMYILDKGQRLGKFATHYRDRFFEYYPYRKVIKETGQVFRRGWHPKEGAKEKIYELIADICISMNAKDYLELPGCIHTVVKVKMSELENKKYYQFERDKILEVEDVDNITAVNAAALTSKLLQYANGAVYDEDHKWHEVHTAKLEALEELVEAVNEEPVIIAYSFKSDLERIMKKLKVYRPRILQKPEDVEDWNEGNIPVLLIHPASAGHGLNLQYGGHHLIWFGLPWNLEHYQQTNKRLDRPGQKFPVIITKLVVEDTMDDDMIPVLEGKASVQDALLNALKVIKEKYV